MAACLKKNILRLIDEQGLTVTDLERQAGLKKSVVRNIIQDKSKNPTYSTLQAIAKELGCNVESLVGGTDNTKFKKSQLKKTNMGFMIEALEELNVFVTGHNIIPTSNKLVSCLQETHDYAVDNNLDKIDVRFLKWTAKRKLLNE
jgi:transcriptional regulator with XRE-family HTH domain